MLLFSSSRKGGKGGSDIWMSVKLKNGRWSPPVNLGDSINTPGNEMAPFLYADNKTLIFSSTGWPGMGKQDLFISRKDKTGSWSKAENIGYPVNTKYAEINLVYSLDGDNVWISSDRDKHGFDIYRIPVYEKIKPGKIIYFAGRVLDKFSKKPVKAKIMLTDELTGTNVTTKYSSREDGYFLMVMEPGKTYAFNILAKGYLFYSGKFTPAIDSSVNRKLNKDFLLTPVQKGTSVVLKNLYFDTDHWNLTAKSYPELKKLIAFLTINPKVKIEIAGHTDDTGNDDYNMKLSKLRAKSVYDYLISKGISPNRLTYNGYGNTRPVFDNSTTEGKALNRRVEVVIKE
jgi:outer membrane protein OmpA-like peptidoglycan-associated protein